MVWFQKQTLAVGTMLWLNWFCETGRSLGLMSPPNNIGMSLAMQVRVDWMNNAHKTANFSNNFDEYLDSGTPTSKMAVGAIDAEQARVNTNFVTHNAEQKKRSWGGVVREKQFNNMQQNFKGVESRYAKGRGRRTDPHRE